MDFKFKRWDGEAGGNRTFWLSNLKLISEMIDKYDLKPVAVDMIPAGAYSIPLELMQQEQTQGTFKMARQWPWPCGGIKCPHLHYGQDVYLIDESQWRYFSQAVIKVCQSKLAAANTVSLEQLIDVSEATSALPSLKG